MRDLKTLQELVASATNWESRKKISCKPFWPKFLDVIISLHASELYSKEELDQISNCSKLSRVESKSLTKNVKRETPKRKRQIEETPPCRQIEETPEEERVLPPMIKKPRKIIFTNDRLSPDLPTELKNRVIELNGYDLKFVMHKQLFNSDVNPNSNRLSMPINEIKCNFFSKAEVEKLDKREGHEGKGRLLGIEVTVLDPCLREFTLLLKKWSMQRTDTYNLVKKWNDIVSVNKFEAYQELQIWSFRVYDKLYFLLSKL